MFFLQKKEGERTQSVLRVRRLILKRLAFFVSPNVGRFLYISRFIDRLQSTLTFGNIVSNIATGANARERSRDFSAR